MTGLEDILDQANINFYERMKQMSADYEAMYADEDDAPDVDVEVKPYRCTDGMCGALDCARCNPWMEEEE